MPEILASTVATPDGLRAFISAHAPHAAHPDEPRIAWWNRWKAELQRLTKARKLFLLGDFNAQLSDYTADVVGDRIDRDQL